MLLIAGCPPFIGPGDHFDEPQAVVPTDPSPDTGVHSAGWPQVGDECKAYEPFEGMAVMGVVDCAGSCEPAAWVGDGICDDGTEHEWGAPDFYCETFDYDGGDCDTETPSETEDDAEG